MNKKKEIEIIWLKYNNYKKTAEQHAFVQLLLFDRFLIPAYNDLQRNWNETHANVFIKSVKEKVFPKLGLK